MTSKIARTEEAAKDARAGLHDTIDRVMSSAHAGVDKVADSMDTVGGKVAERKAQMSAAAKKMAESGRGYVQKRPAVSLLVAAGVGYALSRLLSNRRH